MNRETIEKVLELEKFQKQIKDLHLVLHNNDASKITISNNTGILKNFDRNMIEALKQFCEDKQNEINNEFEKL